MTERPPVSGHSPLGAGLLAFGGLLLRDLRVVRRERVRFLVRTISQPLLLVFVFTYVFPTIGQGIRGPGGDVTFTTVLVPGVVAIAVLVKGIQAVALPLVEEFGVTREIEDRIMAPLPVWGVALEKIVGGALQGLVSALIVFPIVLLVPAAAPELSVRWPVLVMVLLLTPLLASSCGLVLGTFVQPRQVSLMFSVVILPVTFLGATYYPWAALEPIRWLQLLTLLNPLVYMAEAFRWALTPQLPHMAPWVIATALVGLTGLLAYAGVRGFERRVLS